MSGQTQLQVLHREWQAARQYALHLRGRALFPELREYSVSVDLDEPVVLSAIVTYESRLASTGTVPSAPPSARRQRARMVGWGDPQSAAVVATASRLVLNGRLGGWQEFAFADMVDFEADLGAHPWSLEFGRTGSDSVRLSGVSAAVLAVHVAAALRPATWHRHPALQPLLEQPGPHGGRRSPSREVAMLGPPGGAVAEVEVEQLLADERG